MIDLETLGTEPGCAIVSVGAVEFGPDGLQREFYREISVESCQDFGLMIDAETLEWALGNLPSPRQQLTGGEGLEEVLEDFRIWLGDADEIWANAPTFDCRILGHAFEAAGRDIPWSFWQERCHRTLSDLPAAPDLEQDGPKHDALADATHQARVASEALAALEVLEDE